MYVSQTGSLRSSPADGSSPGEVGAGGVVAAADMLRKNREIPVITDLATRKRIIHSTRVAKKRHI